MSLVGVIVIMNGIVLAFCFAGCLVITIKLIKDIWFEKEEK